MERRRHPSSTGRHFSSRPSSLQHSPGFHWTRVDSCIILWDFCTPPDILPDVATSQTWPSKDQYFLYIWSRVNRDNVLHVPVCCCCISWTVVVGDTAAVTTAGGNGLLCHTCSPRSRNYLYRARIGNFEEACIQQFGGLSKFVWAGSGLGRFSANTKYVCISARCTVWLCYYIVSILYISLYLPRNGSNTKNSDTRLQT